MQDENEENFYVCPHCEATFDTEDERDNHVFKNHMDTVEQKLREISELAQEHKQTLQEWKDSKKKELLLKIASENPQKLKEFQGTHGEELMERELEMSLFKEALKTNTLNSFDLMWIRHPQFEEIYKSTKEKPAHQPQSGDSTGQIEETIPMPEHSPLPKDVPINKVSFRSGKLILEPMSKDSNEQLSEKDKALMILYSLLRKKKSN